jgi:hypothetical protein
MKNILSAPVVLLATLSCRMVIDVEYPDFESSLVVHSDFVSTETPTVFLSQDFYVLDPRIKWHNNGSGIPDAMISLYEDNRFIGYLDELEIFSRYPSPNSRVRGYYHIDHNLLPGTNYRIEIEKSGFEIASSETFIPLEEPSYSLGEISVSENQWGYNDYNCDITIHDKPGQHYYEINIEQFTFKPVFDFGEFIKFEAALANAEIFSESLVIPDHMNKILFSDELFEGGSFTINITFRITNTEYYREEYGLEKESFAILKLASVTEDYYTYHNEASLQRSIDNDPLAEPVPIYSNIQNGFGILGGMNIKQDTLFAF